MNKDQHLKYRICGAQAVKAMRKLGHTGTHKELTAFCRRQALGIDKESIALNNIEFDKVLIVFAGYHSMGDLSEQLRLIEQPLKRILFASKRFLEKLGIEEHGREGYLAAIYKRVQAKRPSRGETIYNLADIPDEDFPLILGALNRTLEHKKNPRRTPSYYRKRKPSTARREPANQPPVPTTGEMPF